MNYKNYFEKTMEAMKEYKKSVDVLIPQYQAEVSRHNAELESMKGKYTDSYIAEERAKWKPSKDYQRLLDAEREKRSSITEHYLGKIWMGILTVRLVRNLQIKSRPLN